MIVWVIKIGELLPLSDQVRKMRTVLLAEKLAARGHDVIWWTSAFDHMAKKMLFENDTTLQISEGYTIKALKGAGYKRNVSIKRYLDHRIIANKFREQAKTLPRPDVIVASMPDHLLACEAVEYARREKVPILVDIRDPWPDLFLHVVKNKVVKKLIGLALYRDFKKLKYLLQNADGIIAMMESLLDWGMGYANRPMSWKDRVFYIGSEKHIKPAPEGLSLEFREKLDRLKGKFVITFVGTFGVHTNPLVIVHAAKRLNEELGAGNNLAFVIAGQGLMYEEVVKQSEEIGNIVITGWVNSDQMGAIFSRSHVGVIPYNGVAEFFPNKVFAYLSAGLPIVSSVEGELNSLVERQKLGMVFRPGDHIRLAEIIKEFHQDETLRAEMGKRALKLFQEKFDASNIYDLFAEHVESVARANHNCLENKNDKGVDNGNFNKKRSRAGVS